jgi:hypothetical protein
MIIVKVMGGLGNQMFQYAFGSAIAAELGRELVLDLTSMPTGRVPNLRRWELTSLSIASVRQLGARGLEGHHDPRRQVRRRVLRLAVRALKRYRVLEPSNDGLLDPSQIPVPVAHLVGYWQSYRYFDWMGEAIRSELRPLDGASPTTAELVRRIGDRETISVHVRRGDYVTEPDVAVVHGALHSAYHESAVARVANLLERPLAVVFSDDPGWAVKNLQLGIETIHAEQHRALNSVETLGAMAACRHHVIANSSLSWWGAYLAAHDGQQVIYPKNWFLDRQVDASARFPDHWRCHAAA